MLLGAGPVWQFTQLALPKKSNAPFFWRSLNAPVSPRKYC